MPTDVSIWATLMPAPVGMAGRCRSARVWGLMTGRPSIKVDYLARVEGEGALHIKLKGDRVQDVKLKIFEPPRMFEAFLRGRHFSEAPDITARICGICPVAYQMSAVHAIERALGIAIDPDDGRRGSSDIGNLSYFLPAVHPTLAIVDSDVPGHSEPFREATRTPRGRAALLTAAKFLSMTGYDFLTSEALRQKVKEAFQQKE